MADEKTDEQKTGGKRRAEPKRSVPAGVQKARSVAATVVWVLAVLAAAVLAVGALLIALDFNRKNGAVDFVTQTADNINFLGTLKSFDAGKSEASKDSALVKEVLVNWGIAAVVYLVVGKLVERVIRP